MMKYYNRNYLQNGSNNTAIIASIIGIMIAILSLCITIISSYLSDSVYRGENIRFQYTLRVESRDDNNVIVGAKAVIQIDKQQPIVKFSNSDGLITINVDKNNYNKIAIVNIEATGFVESRLIITLESNISMRIVQLQRAIPLSVTSTPSSLIEKLLYDADFSLWSDETHECVEYEYIASEQARHTRVKCLRSEGTSFPRTKFLDFDLHVTAQKVSGSNRAWYGVVVQEETDDGRRDHRFFVSGIGNYTYEIAKYDAKGNDVGLDIIIPAEHSPAIKTKDDTNTIRVIRRNNVIEFRVNDQTVFIRETSIGGTQAVNIGMTIITQTENKGGDDFIDVAFKTFTVYEAE